MPNNLRQKRRVPTGIEEYIDDIVGRLSSNPAVDNFAVLPFNAESFQKDFNTQLEKFLEQNFAEEDRTFWREKLSLDDSKIFSDNESVMFAKVFGNCAVIFGFGDADANFKILSLSSIKSRKRSDKRLTDFAFSLFMKTFLPRVATSEIVAVLNESHFFTVESVVFELIQPGKYDMINVFIDI